MKKRLREAESGFTLIELMISLGLFALIAVAGLALVQGIINVQGRTEVRLDRLSEVQRTMFVVSSDVDQIASGRVRGRGDVLSFTRAAPGTSGQPVQVNYRLAEGMLVREIGGAPQRLLPGVKRARWRYWSDGWRDRWPPNDTPEAADAWPRAIEMELELATPPGGGVTGLVRRVIVLPARLPESFAAPGPT